MKRCCVSGLGVSVWYDICKIRLRVWDVWVFWVGSVLAEFVFRCLLRKGWEGSFWLLCVKEGSINGRYV